MRAIHSSPLAVTFFLICSKLATGEVHFITPSLNESCFTATDRACHTLSQFVADAANCVNSNTTLIYLPGKHFLRSKISLSTLSTFSMLSESSTATVTCERSANFHFHSISRLYIENLEFIGCGGNELRSVDLASIQNAKFEGTDNSTTALRLTDSAARIANSSFLFNSVGIYIVTATYFNFYGSISGTGAYGGAIFVTHSNIVISHVNFESNNVDFGGAMYVEQHSNVTIIASTFAGNRASKHGGALYLNSNSNAIIRECNFTSNRASTGGVMYVVRGSKVLIEATNCSHNAASARSAVLYLSGGRARVTMSQFTYNKVADTAEVIDSTVEIHSTNFSHNSANTDTACGVLYVSLCYVTIRSCQFNNNSAAGSIATGGAVKFDVSVAFIYDSIFSNNAAHSGGALHMDVRGNITISASQFHHNTAVNKGGAITCSGRMLINETTFSDNKANSQGGAIYLLGAGNSTFIGETRFSNNEARNGGAVYAINSIILSNGSVVIENNSADWSSFLFLSSRGHFIKSVTFLNNVGSLYAFNSNITFAGHARFEYCSPQESSTQSQRLQEGGAISAYRSSIMFDGECSLGHNHAENGGALLATESKVYVSGKLIVSNNTATQSGGGVYLYRSELHCQKKSVLELQGNRAYNNGGGVQAISSVITAVNTPFSLSYELLESFRAQLSFEHNIAKRGGGLSLETNAKLYLLDMEWVLDLDHYTVQFVANSAEDHGGALYMADDSNSDTCVSTPFEVLSPATECFFQYITLFPDVPPNFTSIAIYYSQNYANKSGSILFGGLLDRCSVSPFAKLYSSSKNDTVSGFDYFRSVIDVDTDQNFSSMDVSSFPVRLCFCYEQHRNCSIDQLTPIQVKKGEPFTVSLVAVDQIRNIVSATIQSSLASPDSGLGEGQLSQNVKDSNVCTNLTFNVFSPHDSENLTLYADGPCKDTEPSTKTVHIQFLPCSCPVGFQPSPSENTRCVCECHDEIKQNVICNTTTESFLRRTNIWVSYVNNSNSTTGYLLYLHCPFDYCGPLNVPVNLNQPNGGDAQCAFNRSGLLCGGCQPGLSLSLGSSRCLSCPTNWLGLLIGIIMVAILSGIGLVAFLLLLKMTVAVGTLNALIFYANIVAANSSVLLPFSNPNFITVFISWLNLEIGIDTCFFQGMNAYSKTWLQLAFPVYIIFLVIFVIIISNYYSRFAEAIGRKNPVATLVTLVMLSYTKLLKVIIVALSFGVLNYPDGSHQLVWLPDASVEYLSSKHIPLFMAAVLILLVGLLYTALLFSWQWLLYLSRWRTFTWVRDQRLHAFLETYNAPYTIKHRYWTGLLLLVRALLYLVSAVNVSGDPRVQLASTGIILCCVFVFYKGLIGRKIFKKWQINTLEVFTFFNIIIHVILTYTLDAQANQQAVAYTSATFMFMTLMVIITYHVYMYTTVFSRVKNTLKLFHYVSIFKQSGDTDAEEVLDMYDRPIHVYTTSGATVTHSIVDIADRDQLPQLKNTINHPYIGMEQEVLTKQQEPSGNQTNMGTT